MWHLNIPIFRRLDKVAEHEKHAVLSLARTWWSFAEGVPQVLKTVRVKGLVPLTGPERKQAPRPLPPLPPLPVAPKEDISAPRSRGDHLAGRSQMVVRFFDRIQGDPGTFDHGSGRS